MPCAALLLSVAVAACASRPPPLDASTPAEVEIRVTLRDDFTITANPERVPAGRVKVIATNEGSMMHGLFIEGIGVEQFIAPGTSLTQETVFPAATWVIYCPVTDHRDRGMRGQFVTS
jgi:uncharacterized cupredoxin-like copper-binding protein